MKKILVSLLTVAMLFTIGTTNVFAVDYNNSHAGGEPDNYSNYALNENEWTKGMEVGLGIKPAVAPNSHQKAFDDYSVSAKYRVAFSWDVNGGMYTEKAEWEWNPETLTYTKKAGTVDFVLDANPDVTLTVKNKSNKDVWYSTSAEADATNSAYLAENALDGFDIEYSEDTHLVAPAVGADEPTTVNVFTNKVIALKESKKEDLKAALIAFMGQENWKETDRLNVATVTLKFNKTAPTT